MSTGTIIFLLLLVAGPLLMVFMHRQRSRGAGQGSHGGCGMGHSGRGEKGHVLVGGELGEEEPEGSAALPPQARYRHEHREPSLPDQCQHRRQ